MQNNCKFFSCQSCVHTQLLSIFLLVVIFQVNFTLIVTEQMHKNIERYIFLCYSSFSYKINNKHIGHVLVVAHAKPIELQLSRRELIVSPISGCLAGTEFRRTVRVCNPGNHPAGFTWKPLTEDTKSAFTIKPTRGMLCKYSVCMYLICQQY